MQLPRGECRTDHGQLQPRLTLQRPVLALQPVLPPQPQVLALQPQVLALQPQVLRLVLVPRLQLQLRWQPVRLPGSWLP